MAELGRKPINPRASHVLLTTLSTYQETSLKNNMYKVFSLKPKSQVVKEEGRALALSALAELCLIQLLSTVF